MLFLVSQNINCRCTLLWLILQHCQYLDHTALTSSMTDERQIGKDWFGLPNQGITLAFVWTDWKMPWRTSVRIAGIWLRFKLHISWTQIWCITDTLTWPDVSYMHNFQCVWGLSCLDQGLLGSDTMQACTWMPVPEKHGASILKVKVNTARMRWGDTGWGREKEQSKPRGLYNVSAM
jgi:hypothetical protein